MNGQSFIKQHYIKPNTLMKYLLLIFIIFCTSFSYGQDFPGKRIDLLLNQKVSPKTLYEVAQKYGYKNFYIQFDKETRRLDTRNENSRAFPISATKSDYSKLAEKEFEVVSIYELDPIISINKGRYFVLELENTELGTIYYHYDTKFETKYELEVKSTIELPKDFYCTNITTIVDQEKRELTQTSKKFEGVTFIKFIKDDNTKISIVVTLSEIALHEGQKGLSILLEDGTQIKRPNVLIDVKPVLGMYDYSAEIELTQTEINSILESKIIMKRLYEHETRIKNGSRLTDYLKCLTK